MAGTLDRPLFKRGPQGDTRVALKKGGGPWWQPKTWFGESQMKLPFSEREVWKKDKGTYDLEPSLASQALQKSKNIAKSIGKQSVLYRGNILKKDWTPPKFAGQLGLEGVSSTKQKLSDITVDGDPLMSGAGLARINPINANPKYWDWKQIMFSPKGALKTGAEWWGASTAANLLFGNNEAEAIEKANYEKKETDNIINSNTAIQENLDLSYPEEKQLGPGEEEGIIMAGMEEMGLPITTYPSIGEREQGGDSNLIINNTLGGDAVTKIEQKADLSYSEEKQLGPSEELDVTMAGQEPYEIAKKIQGNNNAAFPAGTENAIAKEFNLDTNRIGQYKDELKKLMPRDDKMTSALMLMQLGLGLMTGKTKRGGLGGFLEIAGKAGQDIIPMAMQVLQNKTKFDQEMALAAFQMAREDDKWALDQQSKKTERYNALMEKIFLKDYDFSQKMGDPTRGPLKTVYQKIDRKLPSGKTIKQNMRWGQVHEDSPLAQAIVYGKPWDMGGGTIVDFGKMGEFVLVGEMATKEFMSEMGLGNRVLESGSARDQMTQLGSVFEANLADMLKFQMEGIHTGRMPTGVAGGTMNWAKKLSENVKGFVNMVRDTTGLTGAKFRGNNLPIIGFTAQAASDLSTALIADGSIISYAGLSKDEQKSIKTNGVWVDKAGKFAGDTVIIDGQNRITSAGDAYVTDQYIERVLAGYDPWNNEQLMVADQMAHIMGFLEARLKQPTGRLLADTIASSIKDVSALGFNAGSPERVAQNLYLHTSRLYNKYADTMAMANRTPKISFDMLDREGQMKTVTIMDYHNSYLTMMKEAGMAPAAAGINLAWTENISEYFPNWNTTLGSGAQEGASNTSNIQYKAFGSPAFSEIMKTLTNDDVQTFGGQQYKGQ